MSESSLIGNWGEYQRLVLAELERHNSLLRGIDDRIQSLKLEIELIKRERKDLEEIREQVKINTKRIDKFERGEETEDALVKYRNWIIGILFIFITALLIPVINLIINSFGGSGG
jgi:hypothetical protein